MKKFDRAVAVLSILVAAVLLISSIVTLYIVTNNNIRLGLVCLFTALFAVTVNMMSNARRAELFASTAASVLLGNFWLLLTNIRYAAVLVVFVSGNLGSPCCNLST
jgi:uncharacterized membrane protein YjjB (DUF3815 family)